MDKKYENVYARIERLQSRIDFEQTQLREPIKVLENKFTYNTATLDDCARHTELVNRVCLLDNRRGTLDAIGDNYKETGRTSIKIVNLNQKESRTEMLKGILEE